MAGYAGWNEPDYCLLGDRLDWMITVSRGWAM